LPNIQTFYTSPERLLQLFELGIQYGRFGDQDIVASFKERSRLQKQCPQSSLGPCTFDGIADLLAGYKSDSVSIFARQYEKHESRVVPTFAGLVYPVEICTAPQRFEVD